MRRTRQFAHRMLSPVQLVEGVGSVQVLQGLGVGVDPQRGVGIRMPEPVLGLKDLSATDTGRWQPYAAAGAK